MPAFLPLWLVPAVLCVALGGASLSAQAQPAPAVRRADPLDARAAVPPVVHDSTLSRARRATVEEPPISWREANDTTARIGGWRAYAREAQQPDAAGPALPAGESRQAERPRPGGTAPGGGKAP